MKPPKTLGKLIYFFGYPVFRILIRGTTRAYVIVRVGDEILATQNWLGFQKKWRLPGGGVHADEDPKLAATRELYEEIGLVVDPSLLKTLTVQAVYSIFKYRYFLYELQLPQKPPLQVDGREILRADFMRIETTNNTLSEEIKQYQKLVKID
jgi:8-oxo-dGTP pyrophosphatase MutT (NUDIX family)